MTSTSFPSKSEALARHFAAFEPARSVIAKHDGICREFVEAHRLKVEADQAADANLKAVLAGEDTTQTQAALEASVQAITEFQDGRWLALFWFLESPIEDLTRDPSNIH